MVPPTDHLSRLCYGKGVEDGQIIAAAFLPRPKENYLSVNWLECLQCLDRFSEIAEIRRRYASFNLKKKDLIAVLNVGTMCSKVAEESPDNRSLNVTSEPLPSDDSHCGIWGFTDNDMLIAELIRLTVLETYPATQKH
jgi:hypothetical protein